MHRPGGEKRISPPEGEGPFEDILRGDGVGNIGNLCLGADAPDDAFERANEAVFGTEVSGEGENGHGNQESGDQGFGLKVKPSSGE